MLDLLISVNVHVIKTISWNFSDVWHVIFSSDPPNISWCEGTGISSKSLIKFKSCAQPMHQIYEIKIVSFLKLVYQSKNELPGTSMAFTVIVSKFEKSHCLLKSSVFLPWQPNFIKALPTGTISKSMKQTREPIFTDALLNPDSL